MAKTQAEDAIGVIRKHRWMQNDVQTEKLKADGCRVVVNLDKTDRDQLVRMIRERTVIKAVYAFFLVDPRKRGVIRMTNDYSKLVEKLANLPRDCHAYIKDVDSGFLAETPPQRKAMLAVVQAQCAKHHKGAKSATNLPRGGQPKVFSEAQYIKAELAWRNTSRYPEWEHVTRYYDEEIPGFTIWRAHKMWGPRQTK